MKDTARAVAEDLEKVFGLSEGPVNTGTVLTLPSTISREQALRAAHTCPLDAVFRDLGAVLARELGNELLSANLRPADYAEFGDIIPVLRDRLVRALMADPSKLASSVETHLRMRG